MKEDSTEKSDQRGRTRGMKNQGVTEGEKVLARVSMEGNYKQDQRNIGKHDRYPIMDNVWNGKKNERTDWKEKCFNPK